MSMTEVVAYLRSYADCIAAPVETDTTVLRVSRNANGYLVLTSRGAWSCHCLVIASGACNVPVMPVIADRVPPGVTSLTPFQYRAPDSLPPGGVMIVGASSTGVQLAREIRGSGRDVVLCVGGHIRLPRIYRGRDIKAWMDAMGLMDTRYDEIDDLGRARGLPSLQLIGTPEGETIDVNSLRAGGVEIAGRLVAIDGGTAKFSGALRNDCALADLKMNRLLDSIDAWIDACGRGAAWPAPVRFAPTALGKNIRLSLDLAHGKIRTVLWATGFRPDYSWLDVPVLDRTGRIRHAGGIVEAPGLYVMGLPFMRRRKSSFIDGAGDDARDLAAHMSSFLVRAAA